MAFKQFTLDNQTTVTIYKRKVSRSLRLSLAPNGEIRVSIPTWVPYKAGLDFARSRQEWLLQQQKPPRRLIHGQQIGKAHHLVLQHDTQARTVTSRLIGSDVIVRFPSNLTAADRLVQQRAESACLRALRAQAVQLLPQRLSTLARKHDFSYSSVTIKHLKSRWGSCDQDGAIVLNLYLMQLPWACIDYVLLHELTHTRVLKHSPEFWAVLGSLIPSLTAVRRAMRSHQPILDGTRGPAVT